MQKGQYIRLFLSTTANPEKVIAAAKQASLHGSATTEEETTKDTTGNWLEYGVTGLSYDISGMALVLSDGSVEISEANTLNDFITNFGSELFWRLCLVGGAMNREYLSEICRGKCNITQLQMQGQNKQNAQYSYSLKGIGAIIVERNVDASFQLPIAQSDLYALTSPYLLLPVDTTAANVVAHLSMTTADQAAVTLTNDEGVIQVAVTIDNMFKLTKDSSNPYKWNITDVSTAGPTWKSFEWT